MISIHGGFSEMIQDINEEVEGLLKVDFTHFSDLKFERLSNASLWLVVSLIIIVIDWAFLCLLRTVIKLLLLL